MSVKKQIPSLSNLCTLYEEVPESFLDETVVDSCFCQNILDIALIDNRIVPVSKDSKKKKFALKLFQFLNLKNQQRFFLEEEVSVSLKALAAFSDNLRPFLKHYDKTVKLPALHHLPKPNQEIGLTLFKDELFANYFQDVKDHCNRQIRLSFRFERNRDCWFSFKTSKLLVSKTLQQRLSIYDTAKCIAFTKTVTFFTSNCGMFDSNFDI